MRTCVHSACASLAAGPQLVYCVHAPTWGGAAAGPAGEGGAFPEEIRKLKYGIIQKLFLCDSLVSSS